MCRQWCKTQKDAASLTNSIYPSILSNTEEKEAAWKWVTWRVYLLGEWNTKKLQSFLVGKIAIFSSRQGTLLDDTHSFWLRELFCNARFYLKGPMHMIVVAEFFLHNLGLYGYVTLKVQKKLFWFRSYLSNLVFLAYWTYALTNCNRRSLRHEQFAPPHEPNGLTICYRMSLRR